MTFQLHPAAFPEIPAPETGRRCYQLTHGPAFHYPLYYYLPSVTGDGRFLVHHRYDGTETQLVRLDLRTGESKVLTQARGSDGTWVPWCGPSGRGVRDHRSVLDPEQGSLLYFDGNDARCVDVPGGEDRPLFTLPEDRLPIGQNCLSPDGREFIYIHHDAASFREIYSARPWKRWLSRGTCMAAYDRETGQQREILRINSPIHHVNPYGDRNLVFCHPATENGLLWTDSAGGWYSHLRTQDAAERTICHYLATRRGLMYELSDASAVPRAAGRYDPVNHRSWEFPLPSEFGYTHTGMDPEGLFWFFETCYPPPWQEAGPAGRRHTFQFVHAWQPDDTPVWQTLCGNWPTYGHGQKSHFHPRLSPDGRWLLFTAGDADTRTNQIFAMEVADVVPAASLPCPQAAVS
mgnify:CR=1 FL=1